MQLAAGAGVKTVNGSETPDFKNNLEITEIIMEINDLRDKKGRRKKEEACGKNKVADFNLYHRNGFLWMMRFSGFLFFLVRFTPIHSY
jgi:hypothetical protein